MVNKGKAYFLAGFDCRLIGMIVNLNIGFSLLNDIAGKLIILKAANGNVIGAVGLRKLRNKSMC
ncbi:MAG: hypothetical protein PHH11_06375 [Methylomonas sp.]|nr:hypothetical protein [Methylomonas sp.]